MDNAFDKVLASRPVNAQTARVMGKGFEYTPAKKITQRHWSSPPEFGQKPTEPNFSDCTGHRFGRFTVVGYFGSKKGGGSLWVCRCSCGDYETRSGKSVRNQANTADRCENCRHLQFLQRQADWLRNPTKPQKPLAEY